MASQKVIKERLLNAIGLRIEVFLLNDTKKAWDGNGSVPRFLKVAVHDYDFEAMTAVPSNFLVQPRNLPRYIITNEVTIYRTSDVTEKLSTPLRLN